MPTLQVIKIKKIKKKKKEEKLITLLEGYADADYAIQFLNIETQKKFKIYVPKRFKKMNENWFELGEIWESELSAIFEGVHGEDIFVYDLDCEDKHWNLYYGEVFEELGEFDEKLFEEHDEGYYVIKTEKGYLKGHLNTLEFVQKEEARTFSEEEIDMYWHSISADLTDFFGIQTIEKEAV